MSAWKSSAKWRPPQVGLFVPGEVAPFLIWIGPAALGLVWIVFAEAATGRAPPSPTGMGELGALDGTFAWTLVWSPLWSFPAVLAMLATRWILLTMGWFGWASAIAVGALSGLAAPIMLGRNFWLVGPVYGAATLWMQQAIYSALYPHSFEAPATVESRGRENSAREPGL